MHNFIFGIYPYIALAVLIIGRLVQGLAGAGGVVIGRAVLADLVTGRAAAKAFTLMLTVGGVAPVLSPFVGSLLLPLLYAATSLLEPFDVETALAVRIPGVVLLLVGLRLFWLAHADLGAWWSATLEVREGQPLIIHGVYARVRHPMYGAILLISAAQGLLLRNTLAGWSALVTFSVLLLVRLPREERMLARAFGARWQAYAERTGALLPRRRGLRS